jgi:Beta-propeller repeat
MSKIIPATLIALAASSLCHAEVDAPYGRLPMAFEANRGQTDPAVQFLARGQGYGLYLTADEAVLSLRAPSSQSDTVVRMQIAGVSPHARISGTDELTGVSNYFVGNDPGHWHTNIPNYAKVKYSGVYPGVDLVYYGNQQSLEYDFVVAPGANPNAIALDFKGVQELKVSEAGDLILVTGNGDMVQHKPVIYQNVAGQRRVIDGSYAVQGTRARFQVARYDHTRPLVIDPTLAYATYFGGKDFDDGYGIAVDASGAAYVTGFIYSGDFPGTWGRECPTNGNGDAFVAKLSRDGSQLVYSTVLGGSGQDLGHGIAVDSKGGAYVTGYTHSQDFPTTRWAVQEKLLSTTAGQNAFVAHLDANGGLSYSTYLGGSGSDVGQSIAVDSSDNAYVTGYTSSGNFPTTSRAFQRSLSGLQNAFITKLNPSGTAIEYSTLLGGDDYDFGFGIAVDKAGNAYVTGTTYGIFADTFPTTSNAYQAAASGSGDAFVSKLSADGSTLVYSTFLGGAGYDGGRGIALDTSGNAYVTGYTQSNTFPTTAGAAQTTLNGTEDAFVTKLNSDGSALVYSTYLGGSDNDAGFGIAVGANGYAYVTGYTQSADFPTTAAAIQTANGTGKEPFVAALNASGAQLAYSTYLGGGNGDGGYAIAVDPSNNAYVTGYTNSVDFPVTTGAYRTELTTGASQDAFIAKLSLGNAPAH